MQTKVLVSKKAANIAHRAAPLVGLELGGLCFDEFELREKGRGTFQNQQLGALGVQYQAIVRSGVNARRSKSRRQCARYHLDIAQIVDVRPDILMQMKVENGRRLAVVVRDVQDA